MMYRNGPKWRLGGPDPGPRSTTNELYALRQVISLLCPSFKYEELVGFLPL